MVGRVRMGNREQQAPAREVRDVRVGRRAAVLADLEVARRPGGEVDVEAARRRVVGREGDGEQPTLLEAGQRDRGQIQERRRPQHTVDHHPHAPGPPRLRHAKRLRRFRRPRWPEPRRHNVDISSRSSFVTDIHSSGSDHADEHSRTVGRVMGGDLASGTLRIGRDETHVMRHCVCDVDLVEPTISVGVKETDVNAANACCPMRQRTWSMNSAANESAIQRIVRFSGGRSDSASRARSRYAHRCARTFVAQELDLTRCRLRRSTITSIGPQRGLSFCRLVRS